MIAGAEEPATLSGLCQPMAIAMVQEKARQARFDFGARWELSRVGLAM